MTKSAFVKKQDTGCLKNPTCLECPIPLEECPQEELSPNEVKEKNKTKIKTDISKTKSPSEKF